MRRSIPQLAVGKGSLIQCFVSIKSVNNAGTIARTLTMSILELKEGAPDRNAEERQRKKKEGYKVYLHIYDMIWLNDYTSSLGIGAFHSGIEVHGREYAYGGHPYSYTGVYDTEPKQAADVAGQGVKYKETVLIGTTVMSHDEVEELIHGLGKRYNGNAYHILDKNCNHFSSELCRLLCGAEIPSWVNRLAYVSSWMPFIVKCLPPSWVTPPLEDSAPSNVLCSRFISKSQSGAPRTHRDSDNDGAT